MICKVPVEYKNLGRTDYYIVLNAISKEDAIKTVCNWVNERSKKKIGTDSRYSGVIYRDDVISYKETGNPILFEYDDWYE